MNQGDSSFQVNNDPYAVDARRLRRSFDAAAGRYDRHAGLQQEIDRRLQERLDWMRIAPRRVVDLGCGTGWGLPGLLQRYPRADVIAADFAPAMVARAVRRRHWLRRPKGVCADAARLPFADASIDLALSSSMLQWLPDPDLFFKEVARVLAPGGLLLFATFGPDTLRELRAAMASVRSEPAVNRFVDMHDLGDAMVRAGLADPVMDREDLFVNYPDLRAVFADLRGVGVRNVLAGRSRGLLGPRRLEDIERQWRLLQTREASPGTHPSETLMATWEVVYGHAWAAPVRPSPTPERYIPITPRG